MVRQKLAFIHLPWLDTTLLHRTSRPSVETNLARTRLNFSDEIMGRRKTPSPETIAREADVLRLRLEGFTFDAIAKQVGLGSPSAAHDAYTRAMKRTLQPAADEIREAELARLDAIQTRMWERMEAGELKAAEIILKVLDRRAKYLGLDSPLKVQSEVTTYASDIDAEVARLASLLAGSGEVHVGTPVGQEQSTTTGQ